MELTELIPLLPQGASVIAVIAVVIIFLRFIQDNNRILQETHKTCEDKLETIADRCNGVIEENTRALVQLIDAVKEVRNVSSR